MPAIAAKLSSKSLKIEDAYELLSIASRSVGNDFFAAMAQALAEQLNVRWVLVSKICRENSMKASAVMMWDGELQDPFDYDLVGSPCENIFTQGACAYPDRLQEHFPADDLLSKMGAHAYVGVPVCSSTGKVLGLLAVLNDTRITNIETALEAIELFAGRTGAELERIASTTDNERLGRIVEESLSEAFIFSAATFRFELANRGARDNLDYSMEELRLLTPWDVKPEYTEEIFREFVAPLMAGKITQLHFDTVHLRKDGTTYDVSVQLQYFPKPDHVFFASITDTTAQNQAAEREQILLREVNHRSKNLLALVQVIARQTAARHPEDYVEALESRIGALAANQDILVHNHWTEIPLDELIRSQLAHFDGLFGERIFFNGPKLFVKSTPAQAIGMAVHELATNAAKYGALSNQTGEISISWSLSEGPVPKQTVSFEWKETGGPPVKRAVSKGFGTAILERQMIGLLGAKVEVVLRRRGLHYRAIAPADRVIESKQS